MSQLIFTFWILFVLFIYLAYRVFIFYIYLFIYFLFIYFFNFPPSAIRRPSSVSTLYRHLQETYDVQLESVFVQGTSIQASPAGHKWLLLEVQSHVEMFSSRVANLT